MEKQTIYTVKSSATEFETYEAIFLPKHTGRDSYTTQFDTPHWLVLGECNKTRIIPQQAVNASWAVEYVFKTKEEAEVQIQKELDKRKENLRKQIEDKQKELEALK
jgi:hypothetical protein